MSATQVRPIIKIAGSVADLLTDMGFAMVGDDKVEALADTLTGFLKAADISVDEESAAAHYREAAACYEEMIGRVTAASTDRIRPM